METIYLATDDIDVSISFDCSIIREKFKVVLIDENNNVLMLENNHNYELLLVKDSRLKIVGDNAYGSLEFSINENII